MIQGQLKTESGEIICEIDLPQDAGEIRLNQYIPFICHVRRLNDEKQMENTTVVQVMAEAIGEFCDVDLDEVFRAKMGDLYAEEETLYDTLRGIWGYLVKVLISFKGNLRVGQDFSFECEGEDFEIPFHQHVALISGNVMPGLNVQQSVECLEIIRLTEDSIKTKGDPKGSLWYSQYLKMLAILTRKVGGETLPSNISMRQDFYQKRAKLFSRIDLQTALDVDFFLQITFERSGKTHPIGGSLILPLLGLGLMMSRWKGKRTKRRRNITRRFSGALAGSN